MPGCRRKRKPVQRHTSFFSSATFFFFKVLLLPAVSNCPVYACLVIHLGCLPRLVACRAAIQIKFIKKIHQMSSSPRSNNNPETTPTMSNSPTPQSNNTPQPNTNRRGGGGARRGRGHRGGRRAPNHPNHTPPTHSETPPTAPTSTPTPPNSQPQGQQTTTSQQGERASASTNRTQGTSRPRRRPARGGRGGGGGRSDEGQRGGRTPGGGRHTGLSGGRAFEGRLTKKHRASEEEEEDDDIQNVEGEEDTKNPDLRGDAPEFVPGARPGGESANDDTKVKTKPRTHTAPKPKPSKVPTKSTAPDIATRVHEDIANHFYECPVCTSELGRRSRIWSCKLCWTVFHLACVRKWSRNEGSAVQGFRREGEAESSSPRAWRCPGCNLGQDIFPSTYSCWCEKETDPRPLPGIPPHSCGQTCSRPRKNCPHPCDSICHAGPCPPCTAMGPTQDCFCGRNSSTKRCRDTDYENGWSCGEICGDLLPCGEHTCSQPCHEGLCGSCEVRVDAQCYCGQTKTQMMCSAKDEEFESQKESSGDQVEEWTGSFCCEKICARPFDCGVHFCQKDCHPQDAQAAHCPRSPDTALHCPCGKTPLSSIPGFTPRTSCEDPIPNCSEACGKILPCGHPCEEVCHTGACGACMRRISVSCRCGRNSFTTVCHQGSIEPPQCFRPCKSALHCGRHACLERCCPGESKALERQAVRRKLKPHLRPVEEDVEAEHICIRVCGRMLKCGRHTCPELCHKGACNTCPEAIFDEISCNCGRTILYPPLPCGTQAPSCSYPCERPKACGHPQTAHNCHGDDELCPKCPFLVEKLCQCGKKKLKNQPCWLADARCGQVCGELLKCGSHTCQKNCHRPGECEDVSAPCHQACRKSKSLCGHPCTEPCHAPFPCPEKTSCSSMVTVTCGCGRLRQERRCNAMKAVVSKGQLHHPQRPPALTPLTCDDECARLERNRSLASALGVGVDPSTTVSASTAQNGTSPADSLPYSTDTLDLYMQLAPTCPLSTLQAYESTLQFLANSRTQRSIRFQPAKRPFRAFAHCLATDWGFATESFDPEPHRHVFVLKPTTWTPPRMGTTTINNSNNNPTLGIGGMSVGECVKIRERQRMKEREAQRLAAAETKALREAARANNVSTTTDGDAGWAQVASRRKPGTATATAGLGLGFGSGVGGNASNTASTYSGSLYSALSSDAGVGRGGGLGGKKERLVLRSGVGTGRQLKSQGTRDVADSWEGEVEREEREEREERGEKGHDAVGESEGGQEHDASPPEAGAEGAPAQGAPELTS